MVIDGQNVEPARTLFDVAFREEALRGAHYNSMLFFRDAKFR